MTTYNKLWTALVGTLLLGLAEFLPDGRLDILDGVKLAQMVAATYLVGYIANTAINRFAKGVAMAVSGAAPVLLVQLLDGWQFNVDLWPSLVAAATALGVIAIRNQNYAPLQGITPRVTA